MFRSKNTPFDDDVEKATSENNLTEDWSLIMLICDNAVNYQDGTKICYKAIMKRLHHNVPRVVIQALTLLDVCIKNCDKRFLLQVASSEFTTEARKLLGKMHPSAVIKFKELIQKWALEDFKDGQELCIIPSFYHQLRIEGVDFPQKEEVKKPTPQLCSDPDAVSSQEEENDIIKAIEISLKDTGRYSAPVDQAESGSTKPLPEPLKVRAIYDFDAAEDNELTIKIGEIVFVSDNSNSSWWKGSNHRGEGLFPANFVTEDLDFKPEEPKIEASPVTESAVDTSEEIEVKINEEKIDTVLNWLNDVDPTEEPSDPEDMLKLEKECYKMGPLIEDNLQSIDTRLAMLNLVNEKIMASFDLFHDLSGQWSALPPNMRICPPLNTMQTPYSQHTMPSVISSMQPSIANPITYGTEPTSLPSTKNISNEQDTNISIGDAQNQVNNPNETFAQQAASSSSLVNPAVSFAAAMGSPPMSQVMHPAALMHPYGPNMMGGIFVPPGMPLPFQPPPQQGGYISAPGTAQSYMNMPYPVQPMGPYIPFPYYYVNNPATPVPQQTTVPTPPSDSQLQRVTLNTSTAVSNVLSATPLPSVSNYYSDLQQIASSDSAALLTDQKKQVTTDQESLQCSGLQASGDGQISSSTSSNENL